jgi:hypothetical protein
MSWDAKRFGLAQWYMILIFSLLGSLFGVLIIFDALHGGQPTRWLIGGALLLEGLMNLYVTVYTVFLRTPPNDAP